MSSQQTSEVMEDQEKQVIEYLRNNPRFFDNNPELLAELAVPHEQSGNVVSLDRKSVV